MLSAFQVGLPLVLAAVLFASAIAKFRRADDPAAWAELGVPAPLRRPWLVRVHPWGELALGIAVVLLGGLAGLIASVVVTVLMGAYLWLVASSIRRGDDASCACFGTRRRITRLTVVRNAWLLILAVAATPLVFTTPLIGGALAVATEEWEWVVVLAVAGWTTATVLWPDGAERSPLASPSAAPSRETADYVRMRTPAVPIMLADGSEENLRTLAARKPILLLAVSETCGACTTTRDAAPRWRELIPEVDVHLLLSRSPDESGWTQTDEPQSLHDPREYVRGSIADWPTPSAVLLGADGFLAGGPASGFDDIEAFVGDIRESLRSTRTRVAV